MSKYTYGGIVADFKNSSSNWVKSFQKDSVRYNTLSGCRWDNINRRCLKGGAYQQNQPSYTDAVNKFIDFNNFVEWSRKQIGYDLSGYELDKDLLVKGNKIYSPETCVFIPKRLNLILIKRNSNRGQYPIGVTKRRGKFIAQCSQGGRNPTYIGIYNTVEEAFQAYKVYKEALIKQVAEEYKNFISKPAYYALLNYTVDISD